MDKVKERNGKCPSCVYSAFYGRGDGLLYCCYGSTMYRHNEFVIKENSNCEKYQHASDDKEYYEPLFVVNHIGKYSQTIT